LSLLTRIKDNEKEILRLQKMPSGMSPFDTTTFYDKNNQSIHFLRQMNDRLQDVVYRINSYCSAYATEAEIRLLRQGELVENLYSAKSGASTSHSDNTSFTINNASQVNIAEHNSKISPWQSNGIDSDKLMPLINKIKQEAQKLSPEDQNSVAECTEVIEGESISATPKKSILKTAIGTLKAIKGSAEFAVLVDSLRNIIATLLV
jgi:hypothetical protein